MVVKKSKVSMANNKKGISYMIFLLWDSCRNFPLYPHSGTQTEGTAPTQSMLFSWQREKDGRWNNTMVHTAFGWRYLLTCHRLSDTTEPGRNKRSGETQCCHQEGKNVPGMLPLLFTAPPHKHGFELAFSHVITRHILKLKWELGLLKRS